MIVIARIKSVTKH